MSSDIKYDIQKFYSFTGLTPKLWNIVQNKRLRQRIRAAYRKRGHDQGISLARHINTLSKFLTAWEKTHCMRNIKQINSRYDKAFVAAYTEGLELGVAKAKHLATLQTVTSHKNVRIINDEHRGYTCTDTVSDSHMSVNDGVRQLMTPPRVIHNSISLSSHKQAHRLTPLTNRNNPQHVDRTKHTHGGYTRTDINIDSQSSTSDNIGQLMTSTHVNNPTEQFYYSDSDTVPYDITTYVNPKTPQYSRQPEQQPSTLESDSGPAFSNARQRHIKLQDSYWSTRRSQRTLERHRDARRGGMPYPSPGNVASYRNIRRLNNINAKRTSILQKALDMGIRYNNQRHTKRMFVCAIKNSDDVE